MQGSTYHDKFASNSSLLRPRWKQRWWRRYNYRGCWLYLVDYFGQIQPYIVVYSFSTMSSAHTHTIGAVDARSANINDICGDQINNNNNVNNISVEISFLPIRNQPPVASASSCTIDNDDHSRSFNDLQNQDIHSLVDTFIQSNAGQPLVGAVVSLLGKIAAKTDLQRLINELLSTLTDPQIYNGLLNALKAHIEVHPWSTAFLVIGIVLLCNPLAMGRLDFGSLDPVAGKSMDFVLLLPFLRNH